MKVGTKALILFVFIVSTYIAGVLIFTKGFLLVRTVIHQNSSCDVEFAAGTDDLVHGIHRGCWTHARFKRAIIVIIDALRYDFLSYNTSQKGEPPIYQNRLKTVNILLNRQPQNARLYKFMADPPTTTLQRLKGLTTGSLPTFVDAGANFDSSEITEDNWVDQLIAQGKDIKFFGDDTWESLFPNRFYKSFAFPSFNVKDLHTVDNGILENLYPEIRRNDWDIVVAHFLGVDHCGHRYGPNHPAMIEKLEQMDKVIRNITQLMKEDTVLFLFGDHGMTRYGDHGGDSEDELTAGLFVYSPAQITASTSVQQDKPVVVQQIDIVPTLTLLLGVPIPFSNLGIVIPDLFNHCPWWHTQDNNIRQVFHTVKALHLNALQVSKYINAYVVVSSDLPTDKFHALQAKLRYAESELQTLITNVATGTNTHGLLERFITLQNQYLNYLSEVQIMCREIWAKFDLMAISQGLMLILSGVIVNVVLAVCWTGEEEEFPAYFPFMIGGVLFQIIYYFGHMLVFPPSVPPMMGFIIGLVIVYALGIVLKKQGIEALKERNLSAYVDSGFATFTVMMYFCAFYSNSFVVNEDALTQFLNQSLLWYIAVRIMMRCLESSERYGRDLNKLSKRMKQSSTVDLLEYLTQPAIATFVVASFCSIVLRTSVYFRICREEQWECKTSSLLQPLSSLAEDVSGFKNQRFFFSVVCLLLTLWLMWRWLLHYGNLNGDGINVLCTKLALPLGGISCALYWAVQALPQKELDSLPPWQQTIMAQIVYFCVTLHILTVLLQPLYVYILHSSPMPSVSLTTEKAVPYVYRQLQQHWNKTEESGKPPVAFGLGSVYSSSLIALSASIFLLLALLLGDGAAPGLAIAVGVLFIALELISAYCVGTKYGTGIPKRPVPWIAVVLHGLLSSTFFYATGHQATIPTIHFESAFTGFHGDFQNYFIPAVLIMLNTYAAPVFFTVISPLWLFWPHLQGPISKWLVMVKREKETEWKGDFELFDNGLLLRKNLFSSSCRILLFHAVKVLGAAGAAGLHRRHLMVWKIFAPRFVFEAVNLILVAALLLIMFLVVLRIDRSVAQLTKTLQKNS